MTSVKRIRVEKLSSRPEPVDIEFEPDVNVLWGLNGSGKTSLLKIIHSALADDASPLLRLQFDSAEVEIETGRGLVTRRITKESVQRLTRRRAQRANSTLLKEDPAFEQKTLFDDAAVFGWETLPSGNDVGPIEHRYLPISRISEFKSRYGRPVRSSVQDLLDEAHYDRVFAEQIQSLWSEHLIRSQARVRFVQQDALSRVISSMFGVDSDTELADLSLTASEAETMVADFLSQQPGMGRRGVRVPRIAAEFDTNANIRRIVSTVQDVIRRIDQSQEPEQRFIRTASAMFGDGKSLVSESTRTLEMRLDDASGQRNISLEYLSSGEKQLLRLLIESLVSLDNCVLVDEPEISLHVDWQESLLANMREVNPDVQVIAASHSPEIIAGVETRSVFEV